jgi:hypothetical protein
VWWGKKGTAYINSVIWWGKRELLDISQDRKTKIQMGEIKLLIHMYM